MFQVTGVKSTQLILWIYCNLDTKIGQKHLDKSHFLKFDMKILNKLQNQIQQSTQYNKTSTNKVDLKYKDLSKIYL